ncbi:30S ribosomal protein S4 [Methanosphaera cuniculi]|uniref:Small ribosomal subunit protein uS4 n=1 Tax=Methanosphaera cuniculi TaxID=1077256 RepID=A0A2A2HB92_9EURY|nr:30S ribosomal protein S4 [Methanosphaera cuniculi]PAV06638.1 30S ribosomal protein S4 [Methanosphaera cuniculi]PWL07826.1 30S ribosomal protein S4 [Methanosphaera cuniculi]
MGSPKKPRKQYDTPSHPWNAERIKEENRLASKYGLKNKKEIWKAETKVKNYRRDARIILGMDIDEREKQERELLDHLVRFGFISPNAKLEEVLDLNVEDVLRRRLQSLVHKKGLSNTAKEARLFVVHGHITVDGTKINAPGHLVEKADEDKIGFYPGSKVAKAFDTIEEEVEEVAVEEELDEE